MTEPTQKYLEEAYTLLRGKLAQSGCMQDVCMSADGCGCARDIALALAAARQEGREQAEADADRIRAEQRERRNQIMRTNPFSDTP